MKERQEDKKSSGQNKKRTLFQRLAEWWFKQFPPLN